MATTIQSPRTGPAAARRVFSPRPSQPGNWVLLRPGLIGLLFLIGQNCACGDNVVLSNAPNYWWDGNLYQHGDSTCGGMFLGYYERMGYDGLVMLGSEPEVPLNTFLYSSDAVAGMIHNIDNLSQPIPSQHLPYDLTRGLPQYIDYVNLLYAKNYGVDVGTTGETFFQFKSSIDRGQPVLLMYQNQTANTHHMVFAYGYNNDDPANPGIYFHDDLTMLGYSGSLGYYPHYLPWSGTSALGSISYATIFNLSGGPRMASWQGGYYTYGDARDWVNQIPPTSSSVVRFSLPASYYDVYFTASAAAAQVVVENGHPQFTVEPSCTYTVDRLQIAAPEQIPDQAQSGQSATLELLYGTLNVTTLLSVGENNGMSPRTSPTLILDESATLNAAQIVTYWPGQITVNGGTLNCDSLTLSPGPVSIDHGGLLAVKAFVASPSYVTRIHLGTGTIQARQSFNTPDLTEMDLFGAGTVDTNGYDMTFQGQITGTGGLLKAGAGKLTLRAWSDYSGGTAVLGGTLQLSSGNDTLSKNGGITVTGGVLDLGGNLQECDSGTVSFRGGTVQNGTIYNYAVDYDAQSGTVSANLDGTVGLTKSGSGTLVLAGNNFNLGPFNFNGGVVQISSPNNVSYYANFNGGALQWAPGYSFDPIVTMTFCTGGGTLDTNGNTTLLPYSTGSGPGGLTKGGGGALVFLGPWTYTGGTTISAGTLQLGIGATGGSILGNVVDNAALVFNHSDNCTFSGAITGSGALGKLGAGKLTVLGANTYGGGTIVSAGTLQGNTGSLPGDIANNATVVFDQAAGGVYGGAMTGTGTLTKIGVGTLTLAGSVTNNTCVTGGRLVAGSGSALTGNLTIEAAGRFENNGGTVSLADLTNRGTVSGSAQVRGTFTNQSSGSVRIAAGKIISVESANAHSNAGVLEVIGNSSPWSVPAEFDCAGPLTNAAGTGLITARNATLRFEGGLTNRGSIGLSYGTTDVSGTINNTGTIAIGGNAAVTFYDDVTQNGTLTVSAVGATRASAVFFGAYTGNGYSGCGDVSFFGDVRPSGGSGNVTFGGDFSILGAARLEVSDGQHFSVAGDLSNAGTIVLGAGAVMTIQSGSGSLVQTGGSLSIGNGATVAAGTIEIAGGTISAADPTALLNSSLDYTSPASSTFQGILAGAGNSLTVNNPAALLILSGSSNTFGGGTNVEAGKLELTSHAALPDGSSVTVGAGATLLFDPSAAGAPVAISSGAVAPVPEPGTLALVVLGLGSAAICRRFRRRSLPPEETTEP